MIQKKNERYLVGNILAVEHDAGSPYIPDYLGTFLLGTIRGV